MRGFVRVTAVLAIAALTVTASGCSGSSDVGGGSTATQDPAALQGIEWQVSAAESEVDLVPAKITLRFEGERAGGFSGVNTYGGLYTAKDDGSIEFGEIAATLMAGPENLMAAEQEYLKLLAACDTYVVSEESLALKTDGVVTLTFEAARAVVLPGSSWLVTNYNNGKQAVVTTAEGSELTIEFGSDGKIAGSSGVNTYNGPYEADARAVVIGPLATTKMAGPADLMEQEAAFLKSLENSKTWMVSGGRLEMRDAGGVMQVTASPAK